MKTPIADFVRRYADADVSRFHMPGHKGASFLGCEKYDVTEIEGADVLSCADGIIDQSEQNASALFATAHSFYSAEGSTLCIKAMLRLATSRRDPNRKPQILAARNAHKAFIHAAALLDLDVKWLFPSDVSHLCSCEVSSRQVEEALKSMHPLPNAVYLTSPDYLGHVADVEGIAKVCDAYGVPLLVDNAHGAYLQFLNPSKHPIALGATVCCDSAHKTLPVLTGGAYLHVSEKAPQHYLSEARGAMALFASTSPSYLILQSLDLCNRYLSERYSERLLACIQQINAIKAELAAMGFPPEDSEPLKLVIHAANVGYTGTAIAAHLRKHGIECEFADAEYLVLMVTPETRELDLKRLREAFLRLSPRDATPTRIPTAAQPHETPLSIRDAILSPHLHIKAKDAEGRICASPTVSCPPAIPITVSGERITKEDILLFEIYGIETVDVVQ